MPAKKTAQKPAKKAANKKVPSGKKRAKPAKKKAAAGKKAITKKVPEKRKITAAAPPELEPVKVVEQPAAQSVEPVSSEKKEMVECEHCQGVGKCTFGNAYDRDHHQGIFQEQLLTSCPDCLTAAGKSRNSKKIVVCRICHGTGQVEKQPAL